MKRFISYGSIEQFRNIVRAVSNQARFSGLDENEAPIYSNDKLPTLVGTASEKIHGTNAAVCYSKPDGLWIQSRKNIITADTDNAGCAAHQERISDEWIQLIESLASHHDIDLHTNIISVYFEWAGGSIQKNTAVSGLDKQGFIFQHFKVSPLDQQVEDDGTEHATWHETHGDDGHWVALPEHEIRNIMNFPVKSFSIDFDNTAQSQNEMIEYVENTIEQNSPVGKQLGEDGNIGEGIVVTLLYKGSVHKFKVKGEKHSTSKVKTLKPVDEEKENAKREFANYACPAWRLEQIWGETFANSEPCVNQTGDFLRAMISDIMKEESDVLAEKGLEPKDVNGLISKVARTWFMQELDNIDIK